MSRLTTITEIEPDKRLLVLAGLLFVLALLLRLGFWAQQGARIGGDTADYFGLAQNILWHHAFSLQETAPWGPSIRRAPLYPLFVIVASLGRLTAGPIVVVQIALDAGTTVLVFVLAQIILTRKWAAVAALFYALHPGAIIASVTLLTETLFTFLLVAALLCLTFGLRQDKRKLSTAAGLLMGLAALCRPLALMYPGVLLAFMFSWRVLPRRFLHGGLFLIAFAVTLAPWAIRCSTVAEQFLLIQGAGPVNWYVPSRWDWNQKDEGTLWPLFQASDYGQRLGAAQTPKEVLDADNFGRRQAIANVKANPAAYLSSRVRSYPYLFLSSFDQLTGFNASFGTLWVKRNVGKLFMKLSLLSVFSLLPLLLGLGGLCRKLTWPAWLPGLMWLSTLLVHLPMWIEYRFFLPVVPFLLVSAMAALEGMTGGNPSLNRP